jgi:hypothetical protein
MYEKIVICGMRQSGSTAFYNIIRFAYMLQDISIYGSPHNKYDPNNSSSVHVRKAHEYIGKIKKWGDLCMVTKRDPRDCLISARKKKHKFNGNEGLLEYCGNAIRSYEDWKPHSKYIFHYEKFKNNSIDVINEVIDVLGFQGDVDVNKIYDYINKIKDMNKQTLMSEDYKETLLKPKFITNNGKIGGYKNFMTQDEIKLFNSNFGDWLEKEGYELD